MSQATASTLSEVEAPNDAFASTRANYERFAFLLVRIGHVPGLALGHLDFRVLLFLLGQKPGEYTAHQQTIAKSCDSNTTSLRQSLARLRAAGLVLWELIPPHHALPTGRFTRTNVNRYWVHLPRLAVLLEPPIRTSAHSANSGASTQRKSDASYGTEIPFEQPLPPTPPFGRSAMLKPKVVEAREAALPIDSSPDFEPIRESWRRLNLGELDRRSERALVNRLAEGATLEQLEAAVAGAGTDEWLRRRAKVPFAVVFASVASVLRFAHEGRKILGQSTSHAQPATVQVQDGQNAGDEDQVPSSQELRLLLPQLATAAVLKTRESPASPEVASAPVDPEQKPASPSVARAVRRVPPTVPGTLRPTSTQPSGEPLVGAPPELAKLLEALSGSMRLRRDARDAEETPQARRLREQAEFDRKRLELVAALRLLED